MDHSGHGGSHHDMSSHNQASHDTHLHAHQIMSADSHNGSEHHGMSMEFHFGYTETILFHSWKINSVGGLIGSMFGIILMAALYEGLKYYREYLFWKTYNSLQYKSVRFPGDKVVESSSEGNKIVHLVGEVIHKQPPSMWNLMHAYQTFLQAVQMVLSYFLMLIFMTYNVWLCMAVILGATIGYFLFGWKKSVVVDVTEHCH
ncbi:hypothetical protein RUM43_010600 [Polyplax serrata]|uniref:Copper transport protein n=1 Tax=Polyplax serrata TaxID=468196 RepID=A0AAN8PKR7_POLSC